MNAINNALVAGCCYRCALRYAGVDFPATDTQSYIKKKYGIEPEKECTLCIVCMNLLDDTFIDSIFKQQELLCSITSYDSETFVSDLRVPLTIKLREQCMLTYLVYIGALTNGFHTTTISAFWDAAVSSKMKMLCGKQHCKTSHFSISFHIECSDENEFVLGEHQHTNEERPTSATYEVGSIEHENTKNSSAKLLPPSPKCAVQLKSIIPHHDHLYIAGRYCKYVRNVCHSGNQQDSQVELCAFSVEDIMLRHFGIFCASSFVFTSAGREDYDVRMLGSGRPFVVKIVNPKRTQISDIELRKIEHQIRTTRMISVNDLQLVDKSLITTFKEAEASKRKTYRALCIVAEYARLEEYINSLNNLDKEITIMQQTPIRVFHRRTAITREKIIHSMFAKSIPNRRDMFELVLETQAGTYVKEFVHGDCGRTKPSVGDLIGGQVDIVTLDVIKIHMDFPPTPR